MDVLTASALGMLGVGLVVLGFGMGLLWAVRRPKAPLQIEVENALLTMASERKKDRLEVEEWLTRATGIADTMRRNKRAEGGAQGGRPRAEEEQQPPAGGLKNLSLDEVRERARAQGKLR